MQDNFYSISVAELLRRGYHFSIPSYQRGYRWEEKQVIDLLEDILQFANDEKSESSYYLQPLVVKRHGDSYEVLDGQQRLTTLMLILDYLREYEFTRSEQEQFGQHRYLIRYQRRQDLDFDHIEPGDNMDSFYIGKAQACIATWFRQKRSEGHNTAKMKNCLFYNDEKSVKFIWYPVGSDSADLDNIQIFNRLNKGKIGLTSSELIKALFLLDLAKVDSLSAASERATRLDAEQFSLQWNELERKFENNDFWYFISNGERQTRMDLLFDFLTERGPKDSGDYAYREFQNLYNFCRDREKSAPTDSSSLSETWRQQGISSMRQAWDAALEKFNLLESWYEDFESFHYVGFLVATGSTPLEIHNHLCSAQRASDGYERGEWTDAQTAAEFNKLIREKFKFRNDYLTTDDIDGLEYGRHKLVRRLLLLHNTETCRRSRHHKFDFDKYKTEHWDLEHIDSQNEHTVQTIEERLDWIDHVLASLDMEPESNADNSYAHKLSQECLRLRHIGETKGEIPKADFKRLFTDVQKFYSFDSNDGDTDIDAVNLETKNKDSIKNLVLLNASVNRSYQDAPFPYKRSVIIANDRSGETFIPPCTRNVFLKYYTECEASPIGLWRWNSYDQQKYLEDIHRTLDPIFADPSDDHLDEASVQELING